MRLTRAIARRQPTARRIAGATVALVLLTGPSQAGTATPDPTDLAVDRSSNFQLYVGIDIDVPRGNSFVRMQRFVNYSAEIRVNGRPERVPIRHLPTLRISREMKLARHTARLSDVKISRTFTPKNDPFRRWASTQVSGPESVVMGREANANMPAPGGGPNAPPGPGAPPGGSSSVMFQVTEVVHHDTFSNSGNDIADTSAFVGRSEQERGREKFDALEVEFELSADTPLEDCYLVMVCDFNMRERDRTLRRWIHLRSLGDVTPRGRTIQFMEAGFPPGFRLVAHELHLFSRGRQVATNLSEKRVQLDAEQALTYLNLQYIAAHRGETRPPAVAWADVPASIVDRVPSDVLRWPVYVEIDAAGGIVSLAADESGRRAVPQRIEAVLRTFRFHPALIDGKAAPGALVLRLADFLPAGAI